MILSMFSVILAGAVLLATMMQTKTSAREVGRANRAAVDWWTAEDELVGERRWWWQRWSTRRQLRSWRDRDTADAIRHVQTVLASWVLLVIVAAAAFVRAAWDWVSGLI